MTDTIQACVHGVEVGQVSQENRQHLFNYTPDTPVSHFISLTMPVRKASYIDTQLHPLFEMHLPEGYLKSILQKHFSKVTATHDFGLLKLLAPNIRGRLTYDSSEAPSSETEHSLQLEHLLHPQHSQLFEELVHRFALRSPLSGVQPKVLAQVHNKATLTLDDYIVKAWGQEYPQLALNEFYCMKAAKLAGIPVPDFYLSDDDALLIMKRFDLNPEAPHPGFEDMCVLQAKHRDDKYTGSYEQIAKTIKLFCSPAYKQTSLVQFFKMMVINTQIQNGDAHLKNFGLLYDCPSSVRLAPAYDIVSTTCYIANDIAALTLLGSKKWWTRKYLITFGINACDLSQKQAELCYETCMNALQKTAEQIKERLVNEHHPDKIRVLHHLLKLMQSDWRSGSE